MQWNQVRLLGIKAWSSKKSSEFSNGQTDSWKTHRWVGINGVRQIQGAPGAETLNS